jgi:hypothetical protein
MAKGLLLIVAGVFVVAQVTRGGALNRLKLGGS